MTLHSRDTHCPHMKQKSEEEGRTSIKLGCDHSFITILQRGHHEAPPFQNIPHKENYIGGTENRGAGGDIDTPREHL